MASTGILVGSFHSSPREQMVMSVRSSKLRIRDRRAVLRLFISEKPRSQTEVSTAMHCTMAASRRTIACDKELEPAPLALHLGRVAAQVGEERLVVLQQKFDLTVTVSLEQRLLTRRTRPTPMLEDACSLEHVVSQDGAEAVVQVAGDARRYIGEHRQ
eukprot:1173009-Prymnesium_polylepis.1